jgi:Fic family protein
MNEFVKELCRKFKEQGDVIDLAAWAHHHFTLIHPFSDGNGRTARLLMSLIFMQAGKNPLLIDNEANYTNACKKKDSSAFADYLRELEQKQVKLNIFLDKCCRSLFENTDLT